MDSTIPIATDNVDRTSYVLSRCVLKRSAKRGRFNVLNDYAGFVLRTHAAEIALSRTLEMHCGVWKDMRIVVVS